MCPHWCHLVNTIELVLPSAHLSLQPKQQIDQFSRFCTVHGRVSSGTLAPPGEYDWDCAHWRHLVNTTKLVVPVAHYSAQPNDKLIGSAVSAQLTGESPHTLQYNGRPFPAKLPLLMGGSGPQHNSWFLKSFRDHNPNGMRVDLAVFAQVIAECPYTWLWAPLSPKLPLPMGGSGPPSNTWFFGPIRVVNPNGISIGSAVFAGLTSVTDALPM